MSSHIVEVVPFTLEPCPNSDALSIARVKGWQCVVRTEDFEGIERAIYIPVDSVVPDKEEYSFLDNKPRVNPKDYPTKEEADLAYSNLLAEWNTKLKEDGSCYVRNKYRRVKSIKIRGMVSQGILRPIPTTDVTLEYGDNVADLLGITKYDPPTSNGHVFGGAGSPFLVENSPLFHKYTEIENIKHFPDIIQAGEPVVYCEKIHGSNFRVALIGDDIHVGSHNKTHKGAVEITEPRFGTRKSPLGRICLRLRLSTTTKTDNPFIYSRLANSLDLYSKLKEMQNILGAQSIIIFGEIFGKGIQDLTYGQEDKAMRLFDISVNGKYMNWEDVECWTEFLGLQTVPVLGKGKFNKSVLTKYSNGMSTIDPTQIREGCVVHPVEERWHPNLGRVILKSIGDAYWLRSHGTENK